MLQSLYGLGLCSGCYVCIAYIALISLSFESSQRAVGERGLGNRRKPGEVGVSFFEEVVGEEVVKSHCQVPRVT